MPSSQRRNHVASHVDKTELPDVVEYWEARQRPQFQHRIENECGYSHAAELDGHDVSDMFLKHLEQWYQDRVWSKGRRKRDPHQRVATEIMQIFRGARSEVRRCVRADHPEIMAVDSFQAERLKRKTTS